MKVKTLRPAPSVAPGTFMDTALLADAPAAQAASAAMARAFAKLICMIFSIENYLVAKDMPADCHSATPSSSLLTLRPLALSSWAASSENRQKGPRQ